MEKTEIVNSLKSVGVAVGGGAVSKVLADKLTKTVGNAKLKHAALFGVSLIAAVALGGKTEAKSLGQQALLGASMAQGNDLLRELLRADDGEVKGVFKTALGSPDFLSSYDSYDFLGEHIEDIDEEYPEIEYKREFQS